MDDDPPAVKPWGIDDKQYLQRLINKGKVDITRTDHDYINRVHQNISTIAKRSTSCAISRLTLAQESLRTRSAVPADVKEVLWFDDTLYIIFNLSYASPLPRL